MTENSVKSWLHMTAAELAFRDELCKHFEMPPIAAETLMANKETVVEIAQLLAARNASRAAAARMQEVSTRLQRLLLSL